MTDIVTAGMSDKLPLSGIDLRARIVAAIAKADQDWCSDNPLYEDVADAVIVELKLRRETVGLIHRYVTNWLPEAASYCRRCGIPHSTPCKRPADA